MTTPQYPKRPGSPIGDQSMPAAKVHRLNASQLQINYLVRLKQETFPLVTVDERMPRILQLIGEYDGVLQRHESMAGNLGACPLGPILLKRFERLFDGPPRVLKSHAKDPSMTWLDVVEFAQNRPEQFNLEKQRNGVRVCQFYHKQCRVEISEEDYVLIASGMPQKLIPPQPISEDEEKELRVMEMLDRNLSKIFQMADQVSARARQLNHKLKTRRAAILARRETDVDRQRPIASSSEAPRVSMLELNATSPVRSIEQSLSPPLGFMAVNAHHSILNQAEGRAPGPHAEMGTSLAQTSEANGQSDSLRADNLGKFLTESERNAGVTEDSVRRSSLPQLNREAMRQTGQARSRQEPLSAGIGYSSNSDKGSPSVAIPNTPASLLPQTKPNSTPKDDGGPYKAEMVARMESMRRYERIIPPCDRCRRLQMDCIKNLTACQGCTKKHAKCSWKDVTLEELQGHLSRNTTGDQPGLEPESASIEPTSREWDRMLKDPSQTEAKPLEAPRKSLGEAAEPLPPHITSPSLSMHPQSISQGLESPKFDLRPPPLDPQARDNPNHKVQGQQGQYPSTYAPDQEHFHRHHPHSRTQSRDHDLDRDEGDRLQELARKVYRSASQSVRPPSI